MSEISQESIEAAAEVIYEATTYTSGYRTSIYKENWDRLAKKALEAAAATDSQDEPAYQIETTLWGGRHDKAKVLLSRTPPRIEISNEMYVRVDDPDTDEFLGLYVAESSVPR